jgi:hypothetical protein
VTPDSAQALRERRPFTERSLVGGPVTPYNQTADYRRGARGSAIRLFAGALNERGTAGVIGSGDLLPGLGLLDPTPAMAMALGEASYIVRSYGTPIAWFLGPEVYGTGPAGKWIEVAEVCNSDYGRFSTTTTKHQNALHAVLTEAPR